MKRSILIAVFSLGFVPASTLSAEKLAVEVVCQLAEHRYLLNLTDQQKSTIEAECSSHLAALLTDRIRFLDFTSGVPQGNQLVVRIGKTATEADPDAFRDIFMDISVRGDNVTRTGEAVMWMFRRVDEFMKVPPPDGFADAIAERFADGLHKNEPHLVKAQLAHLTIAESAFPMPTDQSWLLPFERGELGIADDSQFSIKAELRTQTSTERFTYDVAVFGDFTSATGVPPEFHNKVKALHLRDDKLAQEASIRRLQSADDVDVLHVSVTRYLPAVELERTSPSGLDEQ